MADSGGGTACCRCCFSFILTSGLTALFLWLSLRASKPVCSIQDFYVPALNKIANSPNNHSIYFDLKLDNENKDKAIYYDTLNLTIYYGPNKTLPIANYNGSGFHQGHKKKAHRRQLVETYAVPWEAVSQAVFNGSSMAVFRVDLVTAVRFKIIFWKTKRYKIAVGSTVEVNNSGNKVSKKKGVKLTSGAPELDCYRARGGTLFLFSVFVVLFI